MVAHTTGASKKTAQQRIPKYRAMHPWAVSGKINPGEFRARLTDGGLSEGRRKRNSGINPGYTEVFMTPNPFVLEIRRWGDGTCSIYSYVNGKIDRRGKSYPLYHSSNTKTTSNAADLGDFCFCADGATCWEEEDYLFVDEKTAKQVRISEIAPRVAWEFYKAARLFTS